MYRMPNSIDKCKPFHFVHPFTCMVAGMTGSGKTISVRAMINMHNLAARNLEYSYSEQCDKQRQQKTVFPDKAQLN